MTPSSPAPADDDGNVIGCPKCGWPCRCNAPAPASREQKLETALREIDEHINVACRGDALSRNLNWLKSKLPISEIIERALLSVKDPAP